MELPRITWQDAQQLPDDGRRHEAIAGDLYMTPAPSVRHQTLSLRLALALHELLVDRGLGRLWTAPIGVEFPDTGEGVQPDLVFVAEDRLDMVGEDWIRGAPDLVIEILSPSTRERDRDLKLELYRRHAVRHYWIVDPDEHAVDVWKFADEPRHERFTDRLPVRVGGEEVGFIDLADIFAEAS